MTFKHHYADWQGIFCPVFPASTNKDPKVFNEGWRERPLTSAGPFKLDKIDKTAHTITLVRNEKWWGNPANSIASCFVRLRPPPRIDALANGEIDAMDIGPDANMFNRAKDTAERRDPRGRWPELPPHHGQRDEPQPAGRPGPPGTGDGYRPRHDCQGPAGAARPRATGAQ